jgi:hypothetical protein
MASFAMVFKTEQPMNIIFVANTPECPEGEAQFASLEWMKQYHPFDTVSKLKWGSNCQIKTRKGGNPGILFENLTAIQNQYLGPGSRLPKEEMIPIILDVASEEYRDMLTVVRRMRWYDRTVEDLEDAMNEEYRQPNRGQTRRVKDNQGELLLTAFQGSY